MASNRAKHHIYYGEFTVYYKQKWHSNYLMSDFLNGNLNNSKIFRLNINALTLNGGIFPTY